MYKLTYGLTKVGEFKTFEAAFIDLFDRINADFDSEGMSWQFLETMIWIETPERDIPTFFYEARDTACTIGLLVDGKIPDEKRKEFQKEAHVEEEKEEKIKLHCPKCKGDLINDVPHFDNVKQCGNCEHQFLSSS